MGLFCSASHTWPMPPSPSICNRRYGPICPAAEPGPPTLNVRSGESGSDALCGPLGLSFLPIAVGLRPGKFHTGKPLPGALAARIKAPFYIIGTASFGLTVLESGGGRVQGEHQDSMPG